MSFKEFSSAHGAPAKGKADDKIKGAPAADQSPARPEKAPAEVAPAGKS
jgi:hypothetical protein